MPENGGFWPHVQKVLLFSPSPSCRTRTDLVLPKAGEKRKVPGEWLQFSLLAAGRSVYCTGEGGTVLKLPAGLGGEVGCCRQPWVDRSQTHGWYKALPSLEKAVATPPAISSVMSANGSPVANARWRGCQAMQTDRPQGQAWLFSTYLKLQC